MNLKTAIVYTCTLATLFGIVGNAEGKVPNQANRRHHQGIDYNDYNDYNPRPQQRAPIRLKAQLNERLTGQNTLKIKQILNIGQRFRGATLKKVILVAQTDRGRGKATLMINGYHVQQEQVGMYKSRITFFPNPNENIIGQEVRTIQIKLKGKFDVTKVVAVLEKKQQGHPDNSGQRQIAKRVNMSVYANSMLSLSNIMDTTRRENKKIVDTVIIDLEAGRRGEIKLCTKGYYQTCTRGKLVRGQQKVRFELSGQQELGDVMVKTQGNMTLKKIKVLF